MSLPLLEEDLLYEKASFPPVPDPEDMEMFKQQVAEWVKLDESVKKLMVAMRERRVHQRALATKISQFMQQYGYDDLNTQQGRIRSSVRQVKAPLRIQEIREELLSLGEEVRLTPAEFLQKIFEKERPVTTKQSLRRIIPKVSMRLDL